MPLYNLACTAPLDEATRLSVAEAVTEVHCRVTGAPPQFVNVIFLHGYPLAAGLDISALGGVRTGGNRSAEVIERLRLGLQEGIAHASGRDRARVDVSLIGVPSNWVMEGGRVMPEPGAEDEWLQQGH